MKTLWVKYALFGLCIINNHSVMSMDTNLDDPSKPVRSLPPLKPIEKAIPRQEPRYSKENTNPNPLAAITDLQDFVAQLTARQTVESH